MFGIYFLLKLRFPKRGTMSSCPKCGSPASSPDALFCALCGYAQPSSGSESGAEHPGSGIPWESVAKTGVMHALLETIREILFSPMTFFSKVSSPHNAAMSFVFALIVGSVGSVLGFFWTHLLLSRLPSSFAWLDGFTGTAAASGAGLILVPLFTAVKVLFAAVYFQTLLTLTGTRRQGIKSTFSIVCYTESASLFNLIPLLGSVVSVVWSLFLLAAGFNSVHRMSTTKALVIILLPLLILGFLCILALALAAAVGTAILSGSL
jgi:hypothetical protein